MKEKHSTLLEDRTVNRGQMLRGGAFLVTRFGLYLIPIVCLIACQLLIGCTTLKLTPVADPPTGVYHEGKFVWYDLLTPDVAAARDFYGDLFGWSFKKQGRYTVVLNKGQAIGGMVKVKPKDKKDHAARWLASLSVPDVDQAAALVQRAGGTVHEGPVDLKKRGRGALVTDPQGAQLLLLHSSGGDPADNTEPPLGSWLWIELWSKAPEEAVAFYEELGGYSSVEWKDDYWLLWNEEWRGGVRFVPSEDMDVRWTPTVRVPDTAKIAEQAETLGGRVVVQPREVSIGGSVALIEDPLGGLVIVQQWSKQSSSAGE